ncbi:hypothetical protein [Bradyrhizobium erythrophlei]|jgi:hypothetical protein|uniref:Uncharacterized protein n=1 Tax=Bradyrhizobium erythrophlei TaxID=1437360 RepID=A0A1M7UKV2_9BRAD|nr:hypothetical protein [Bradyrhizobium erythrophlei]SHN83535.1 hypothetical protein SAMN05444170_5541 [Bradyrhizobium erythrophlei]
MAKKAEKRVSTPRKTASKKPKESERSEVIEQCVIYLQATAAYEAGCSADNDYTTHAGAAAPLGKEVLDRAKNALGKLAALSADRDKLLSFDEMRAKSTAFKALMLGDGHHSVLEDEQIDFLQSFAKELVEYFRTERHASGGQPHDQ